MAGYNDWLDELALIVEGEPTVVRASTVTGSFFEGLRVPPIEGRVFDETHTQPELYAPSERSMRSASRRVKTQVLRAPFPRDSRLNRYRR